MLLRTVLVDDELAARKRLRELLKEHKSVIKIIGEADNGDAAIEKINKLQPDLLFLDIHLAQMNAFSIIEKFTCEPYVIFVTGYDQYAIQAFEYNALDYLLKPIEQQRLEKTIQRISDTPKKLQLKNTINDLKHQIQLPTLTMLQARIGDTIHIANVEDVLYFEAEDYYCAVYTTEKKKLLIRMSLQELELRLPKDRFFRIHRKYIVNKFHIRLFRKPVGRAMEIILDDCALTALTVSRSYNSATRQALSTL